MNLAADAATSDATLLRAGRRRFPGHDPGWRPATRGIWPDVVAENKEAILSALDRLCASLDKLRAVVASGDRAALLQILERAREGRVNLPSGAPAAPARLGGTGTRTGPAWCHRRGEHPARRPGVNIFDVEIAHSAEGDRGVMVLIVDASAEEVVRTALGTRGYRGLGAPARDLNRSRGLPDSGRPAPDMARPVPLRAGSFATGPRRTERSGAGRYGKPP